MEADKFAQGVTDRGCSEWSTQNQPEEIISGIKTDQNNLHAKNDQV